MTIPSTPSSVSFSETLRDPLPPRKESAEAGGSFFQFLNAIGRFFYNYLCRFATGFFICLYWILWYPQAVDLYRKRENIPLRERTINGLWKRWVEDPNLILLTLAALALQFVAEALMHFSLRFLLIHFRSGPLPPVALNELLLATMAGSIVGLILFFLAISYLDDILHASVLGPMVGVLFVWFIQFSLIVLLQFEKKFSVPWEVWGYLGSSLGLIIGVQFSLANVINPRDKWSVRWHTEGLLGYLLVIPITIALLDNGVTGLWVATGIPLLMGIALLIPEKWLFFLHRDPLLHNWGPGTLTGYLLIVPFIIVLISSWENALICSGAILSGLVIGLVRPDDWLIFGVLFIGKPQKGGGWRLSHISPIPARKIKGLLTSWLKADWNDKGLKNLEELSLYTNQHLPIRWAVRAALKNDPLGPEKVVQLTKSISCLRYIEFLARKPRRFGLSSVRASIKRRWRSLESVEYSLDTPTSAFAAGLVYLFKPRTLLAIPFQDQKWLDIFPRKNRRETIDGKMATSVKQDLTNASEAFAKAGSSAIAEEWRLLTKAFITLWEVEWIGKTALNIKPPPAPTRGKTWDEVKALGSIAQTAWLAYRCGPTNQLDRTELYWQTEEPLRNALTRLEKQNSDLEIPEKFFFNLLVKDWERGLSQLSQRSPIIPKANTLPNPFTVTRPVSSRQRLAGPHKGLSKRMEDNWRAGCLDPVAIVGAPLGGKTSMIQVLVGEGTGDIRKVLIPLGSLQTTSSPFLDLLRLLVEEICRVTSVSRPDESMFGRDPVGVLDQQMRRTAEMFYPRGLILILDDFDRWAIAGVQNNPQDLIEAINFLTTLERSIPTLGLLITSSVSIESLVRRGVPISQFQAQTHILNRFDRTATQEFLTNLDKENFLYFRRPAMDELYRLTGGLPFLVQLLGQSIVALVRRQLAAKERDNLVVTTDNIRSIIESAAVLAERDVFIPRFGAGLRSPIQREIIVQVCRNNENRGVSELEFVNTIGQSVSITRTELIAELRFFESLGLLEEINGFWKLTSILLHRWLR